MTKVKVHQLKEGQKFWFDYDHELRPFYFHECGVIYGQAYRTPVLEGEFVLISCNIDVYIEEVKDDTDNNT